MSKVLNMFDVEQLAIHILGLSDEASFENINEGLVEEYNIGFKSFELLANTLIKMTMPINSPISDKKFFCFGELDGDIFKAIAKLEV